MRKGFRGDFYNDRMYMPGEEDHKKDTLIAELRSRLHEQEHLMQRKNDEIDALEKEIERFRDQKNRRDEPPPFKPVIVEE
jgi:HAMP domain-containing protein